MSSEKKSTLIDILPFKERVKMMECAFISDTKKGLSILQIAEKYQISESTVYRRLDKIAAKYGIPRTELLAKKGIATRNVDLEKIDDEYEVLMGRLRKVTEDMLQISEELKKLRDSF